MTGKRRQIERGYHTFERTLFRYGAIGLFFLFFLYFVFVGLTHNLVIVAALSGVAIFIMAAILLPKDRLQRHLESLATGEAGEKAHDWWCRHSPLHRDSMNPNRSDDDRRGQTSVRWLVVLAVVVIGLALLAGAATAQDDTAPCETEVVHDAFLYDESTVTELDETGNATSIDGNTRVRLEDTEAFLRVKAENPNAYCVKMSVLIHPDIVSPADVGSVDAKSEDVDAEWKHVHDFEADQSYTEVTFELEGGSEATFAPSTIRTKVVNFRDQRENGIRRLLGAWGDDGDDEVEQHVYEITAENSSFVTVQLSQGDRQVEDYHAFYRVSEDDPWKPVTTDSEDPVFERRSGPDDEVQFVFNDEDATVEFVANPTLKHQTKADYRSLKAGLSDLNPFNWSIGTVQAIALVGTTSRRSNP